MKTTPSAIKRAIMVAKAIGSKIDPGFDNVSVPTDGIPLLRADGGEAAPKFYSQGAKQAEALPQETGSPEQMLGMLANRGVKPDEMRESGIQQAFYGQPKVSRQQLSEHFQAHIPEINEEVTPEGHGQTAWERFRDVEPRIKLPGGENYREITMHAPRFEDKREKVFALAR